jgi:hypothetical protein
MLGGWLAQQFNDAETSDRSIARLRTDASAIQGEFRSG